MALMCRQLLALCLIVPLGLFSAALADPASNNPLRPGGSTLVDGSDVAHHLNSFAMIFGRCVWIPPSPKAALAALTLFYGVGITGNGDIESLQADIADQYVARGKSQSDADTEINWLNTCFGTYETPPENQNHPMESSVAQQRRQATEPNSSP